MEDTDDHDRPSLSSTKTLNPHPMSRNEMRDVFLKLGLGVHEDRVDTRPRMDEIGREASKGENPPRPTPRRHTEEYRMGTMIVAEKASSCGKKASRGHGATGSAIDPLD